MLEMNKTASYKQHNQMVQNSRNEQIENVDEPNNMKAKPKRQYKCKNINESTQQLEDQSPQYNPAGVYRDLMGAEKGCLPLCLSYQGDNGC